MFKSFKEYEIYAFENLIKAWYNYIEAPYSFKTSAWEALKQQIKTYNAARRNMGLSPVEILCFNVKTRVVYIKFK